jgi:hypothetical protein
MVVIDVPSVKDISGYSTDFLGCVNENRLYHSQKGLQAHLVFAVLRGRLAIVISTTEKVKLVLLKQ